MKVEKKESLYIWLPTGTYHKEIGDFEIFPSKSDEFGTFFP